MNKSRGRGLVTIIINNYNYAQYLRYAIDSALAQTYSPIQVIVVDDGSIDDSRQVIQEYRDTILPVFKSNGGQGSAFNTGLRHCSGDYVIFLDADDILLPHTVEHIVEVFQSNPDTAKVEYRMEIID